MAHSPLVNRMLNHINGTADKSKKPNMLPSRAAPMVTRVKDPQADAEGVVSYLDGTGGPRPNGWLQRRKANSRVNRKPSGLVVFDQRECCMAHLRAIDRRLHLIRLPYDSTCDTCGAEYRIAMGVTAHGT